jgi:agmatinase
MEVVEVSPPYDVAEVTSLLASRLIMDVLGTLVLHRKLGRVPSREEVPPVQEA